MDIELVKSVGIGALVVVFFVLWARYLRNVTLNGQINRAAQSAARRSSILPAFVTAAAVIVASIVSFTVPGLFGWAPLLIGAAAMGGASWAVLRMTAAAQAAPIDVPN